MADDVISKIKRKIADFEAFFGRWLGMMENILAGNIGIAAEASHFEVFFHIHGADEGVERIVSLIIDMGGLEGGVSLAILFQLVDKVK